MLSVEIGTSKPRPAGRNGCAGRVPIIRRYDPPDAVNPRSILRFVARLSESGPFKVPDSESQATEFPCPRLSNAV